MSPRGIERTTALVVRLVDFGEADRIVGLFTKSLGLVSAIAKSARRSTKRFGGALQTGQLLEVDLARGAANLGRLESARIVDAHLGLVRDLGRLDEAAVVLRSIRDHLPEAEPDPELFELTARCIRDIAEVGPSATRLVSFRLRLFDRLGVGPELDRCVRCGKSAGERAAYVDARRGGIVCRSCGGGGLVITPGARTLARRIRSLDEEIADSGDALGLGDVLDAIAEIHLASRGPART